MKKLTAKLKAILGSNKGESLMESLMSIIIFAVMIEAVTLMIMTALRMNSSSITKASASQTSINSSVVADYGGLTGTATLDGGGIHVEIILPTVPPT